MARTRKNNTKQAGAYVAYYRVSTTKQGESGLGLDAQRTAVMRHLGTQGNLIAEYTEVESGKKTDRPELAAALAHARRAGAVLIIAKLDRLARNVAFISRLMEEATEFVACDMPHANRLTLHIMAAMAEHEAAMISARTVAALAEAKKRGTKLGNPNCLEALERARVLRWPQRQASQVDAIVRDRHAKGETLRQIAGVLNGLGLKTPSGAAWHPSSVRAAILRTSALPDAA